MNGPLISKVVFENIACNDVYIKLGSLKIIKASSDKTELTVDLKSFLSPSGNHCLFSFSILVTSLDDD